MYNLFQQLLSMKKDEFDKMIQVSNEKKMNKMNETQTQFDKKQKKIVELHRFVAVGNNNHDHTKFFETLNQQSNTIIKIATKHTIIAFWLIVTSLIVPITLASVVKGREFIQTVAVFVAALQSLLIFLMYKFSEPIYGKICIHQQTFCIKCFEKQETVTQINKTIQEKSNSSSGSNKFDIKNSKVKPVLVNTSV